MKKRALVMQLSTVTTKNPLQTESQQPYECVDLNDSIQVSPPSSSVALRRSLYFVDGLGVIVGIMIGSGIFASPGVALERVGCTGGFLLAW